MWLMTRPCWAMAKCIGDSGNMIISTERSGKASHFETNTSDEPKSATVHGHGGCLFWVAVVCMHLRIHRGLADRPWEVRIQLQRAIRDSAPGFGLVAWRVVLAPGRPVKRRESPGVD